MQGENLKLIVEACFSWGRCKCAAWVWPNHSSLLLPVHCS